MEHEKARMKRAQRKALVNYEGNRSFLQHTEIACCQKGRAGTKPQFLWRMTRCVRRWMNCVQH